MTGYTHEVANAVSMTYDFSPFKTVVDVGGSYGTLLSAILQRNPTARGFCSTNPMSQPWPASN